MCSRKKLKVCYQIRVSSLRRQHFSDISKQHGIDLQLLRDVDIRWSSTLYMIERALHLEKVWFVQNLIHMTLITNYQFDSHLTLAPAHRNLKIYIGTSSRSQNGTLLQLCVRFFSYPMHFSRNSRRRRHPHYVMLFLDSTGWSRCGRLSKLNMDRSMQTLFKMA